MNDSWLTGGDKSPLWPQVRVENQDTIALWIRRDRHFFNQRHAVGMWALSNHIFPSHATNAPLFIFIFFITRRGRRIFTRNLPPLRFWVIKTVRTQWERSGRCSNRVEAEFKVASIHGTITPSPLFDFAPNW